MDSNLRFVDNYKTPVDWSVNNLSLAKRSSIKQGVHIPIMFEKCYSTDSFDVEFASKLQSNPLVAPLMGDFVLRFSTFKSDLSNYYGWLDNNERVDADKWLNRRRHFLSGFITNDFRGDSGDILGISSILPIYPGTQDWDGLSSLDVDAEIYKKICVRPGSVLDFIGVPPGYICPLPAYDLQWSDDSFTYSLSAPNVIVADRLLVYLDVIRNYMVNNQYDTIPYLAINKDTDLNSSWTQHSELLNVSLRVLDFFFKMLRMEPDGVDIGVFLLGLRDNPSLLSRHEVTSGEVQQLIAWFENVAYGGMFCAQFAPDMMQNLLQKVGSENVQVSVDEETGSFTIQDLRFKNKLQHVHEDINVAGGRPDDVNQMLWHSKGYGKLDIPSLISVSSFDVNPQNVVSTAQTSNASGPVDLGQVASRVNNNDYQNEFGIKCDWDAVLMTIVTLIPKVDYFEGIDKDLDALMFADDFKPQFNQLGFQDVPYYRYNALPSYAPTAESDRGFQLHPNSTHFTRSVGKTVAFVGMRSNVNRVHGEFATYGNAPTWVLARTFRRIGGSAEAGHYYENRNFSPYINPGDFQYPFALNDANVDNWFLQVGFKIRAVRPISNQARPTLE